MSNAASDESHPSPQVIKKAVMKHDVFALNLTPDVPEKQRQPPKKKSSQRLEGLKKMNTNKFDSKHDDGPSSMNVSKEKIRSQKTSVNQIKLRFSKNS